MIAQLALGGSLIKEQKRQAAVANLIDHAAALANEAALYTVITQIGIPRSLLLFLLNDRRRRRRVTLFTTIFNK